MNKNKSSILRPIKRDKLYSRLTQSKYFIGNAEFVSDFKWGLYLRSENLHPRLCEVISDEIFQGLLSDGLVKVAQMTDLETCNSLGTEGLRLRADLTKAGRIFLKRQLTNNGEICGQHQINERRSFDEAHEQMEAIVNLAESPLSWLATRKDKNGKRLIEDFQFVSGERLRTDFEKGLMAPNMTRSWEKLSMPQSRQKTGPSLGLVSSEAVVNARQKVALAIKAVGPELSSVLLDVCCEQRGLEEAEKRNSWPKRSGKVLLSIALTRLARHYGLISDDRYTPPSYVKIMHWGAEDYRPTIDG